MGLFDFLTTKKPKAKRKSVKKKAKKKPTKKKNSPKIKRKDLAKAMKKEMALDRKYTRERDMQDKKIRKQELALDRKFMTKKVSKKKPVKKKKVMKKKVKKVIPSKKEIKNKVSKKILNIERRLDKKEQLTKMKPLIPVKKAVMKKPKKVKKETKAFSKDIARKEWAIDKKLQLNQKQMIPTKQVMKKPVMKVVKEKPKKKGFFSKMFGGLFGEKEEPVKEMPMKKTPMRNMEVEKVRKEMSKKMEEKKNIIKSTTKKKTHWKKGDGEYVNIGVQGFDKLFENGAGIPHGASVLVEGGPGSGKTVFCLASINELCKKGKKCLYMSFEEPEEKLIQHMEEFGWDASQYVKKGQLRVTRFDALDVSRSIEALLSAAKKELLIDVEPMFFPEDFKPDFVVIDSLTSIASAFSGEENRFRIYMEQLFRYLESNGITNFLIREVSSPSHIGTTFTEQGEAVSFLSDGIIVVYNIIHGSGNRTRAMEILKMRGSSFKEKIVEMEIVNKKGVVIYPEKVIKRNKHKDLQFT